MKIKAIASRGMLMINIRTMGTVVAIFTLLALAPAAHSQNDAHEDLSPCPGSSPEPTQSSAWSVAFCNRTGHDVVIEFHDNDCPAKDWSRRGDVYQRTLRRGESRTLPLCYANEPAGKKPAPGTPTLRIPGGKGVVTTWNVVGDCGDRSKALSIDARTFYDRGDYKSGIVLLQYPAGASHCVAEVAGNTPASPAAAPTMAVPSPPAASHAAASQSPAQGAPAGTAAPPVAATLPAAASIPAAAAAPAHPRSKDAPTLAAAVNAKDVIGRSVQVFAKGGAGYKCNFNLGLVFSDGATWNDRVKLTIEPGDTDAPIVTRKYFKTVTKVEITSSKCDPPTN